MSTTNFYFSSVGRSASGSFFRHRTIAAKFYDQWIEGNLRRRSIYSKKFVCCGRTFACFLFSRYYHIIFCWSPPPNINKRCDNFSTCSNCSSLLSLPQLGLATRQRYPSIFGKQAKQREKNTWIVLSRSLNTAGVKNPQNRIHSIRKVTLTIEKKDSFRRKKPRRTAAAASPLEGILFFYNVIHSNSSRRIRYFFARLDSINLRCNQKVRSVSVKQVIW